MLIRLQGIPLGAAVAYTLADRHNRDVGFAYNRKEAKDHGEKGILVGEDLKVILVAVLTLFLCGRQYYVLLFIVVRRSQWPKGGRFRGRLKRSEDPLTPGQIFPRLMPVLVCGEGGALLTRSPRKSFRSQGALPTISPGREFLLSAYPAPFALGLLPTNDPFVLGAISWRCCSPRPRKRPSAEKDFPPSHHTKCSWHSKRRRHSNRRAYPMYVSFSFPSCFCRPQGKRELVMDDDEA